MRFRPLVGMFIWLSLASSFMGCNVHKSSHSCCTKNSVYTFRQVQSVLDSQLMGWNSGSIDKFMEGYWNSDSLLFITQKGPRYGFQKVSDSYKKNYPSKDKMGQLTFEILSMRWIDQPASISEVLGKWKVTEISGKQAEGYFSLIFKHIDGGPKIVIDHTW